MQMYKLILTVQYDETGREGFFQNYMVSYPWVRSCCTVCKRSLKLSNILPGVISLDSLHFLCIVSPHKLIYFSHLFALLLLCALRNTADLIWPIMHFETDFQNGCRRRYFYLVWFLKVCETETGVKYFLWFGAFKTYTYGNNIFEPEKLWKLFAIKDRVHLVYTGR